MRERVEAHMWQQTKKERGRGGGRGGGGEGTDLLCRCVARDAKEVVVLRVGRKGAGGKDEEPQEGKEGEPHPLSPSVCVCVCVCVFRPRQSASG